MKLLSVSFLPWACLFQRWYKAHDPSWEKGLCGVKSDRRKTDSFLTCCHKLLSHPHDSKVTDWVSGMSWSWMQCYIIFFNAVFVFYIKIKQEQAFTSMSCFFQINNEISSQTLPFFYFGCKMSVMGVSVRESLTVLVFY